MISFNFLYNIFISNHGKKQERARDRVNPNRSCNKTVIFSRLYKCKQNSRVLQSIINEERLVCGRSYPPQLNSSPSTFYSQPHLSPWWIHRIKMICWWCSRVSIKEFFFLNKRQLTNWNVSVESRDGRQFSVDCDPKRSINFLGQSTAELLPHLVWFRGMIASIKDTALGILVCRSLIHLPICSIV